MQKRRGALVQRTSPRRPAHHKLPQGEGDRIVARVLGRIQVNGITVGCDKPAGDVGGVASQVEHTDVDPDVRLLLLSQSGRYKRQGGMEAPPNRGVSRVLE
jgi:hypothetical protein